MSRTRTEAAEVPSKGTRDVSWPDVAEATRRIMRANKGKDTKPEMQVRSLLHGMGYRYRLHRRDLPGTPDIVFPCRKKAIFVHGCFWHWHDEPRCRASHLPKARGDFWLQKLSRNRERDQRHKEALLERGWGVLVLWECQLKDAAWLHARVEAFLGVRSGRYVSGHQ